MAKVVVDNSFNMFGGFVSIAELAQFIPLLKETKSEDLNIYQVQAAMDEDFHPEISRFEFEYTTGYSVWFKDGSALHVSAWADCEDPSQYGWH